VSEAVKRQAALDLRQAVSAAESKASELLAAERAKMERLLGEARRQAQEEALAQINRQDESTEVTLSLHIYINIYVCIYEPVSVCVQSCWNCGRKANETCSGCNVARYCGAFCQHKDWENHHRACGSTTQHRASSPPPATTAISDERPDSP
jgi:runt-related transcription factor 1